MLKSSWNFVYYVKVYLLAQTNCYCYVDEIQGRLWEKQRTKLHWDSWNKWNGFVKRTSACTKQEVIWRKIKRNAQECVDWSRSNNLITKKSFLCIRFKKTVWSNKCTRFMETPDCYLPVCLTWKSFGWQFTLVKLMKSSWKPKYFFQTPSFISFYLGWVISRKCSNYLVVLNAFTNFLHPTFTLALLKYFLNFISNFQCRCTGDETSCICSTNRISTSLQERL